MLRAFLRICSSIAHASGDIDYPFWQSLEYSIIVLFTPKLSYQVRCFNVGNSNKAFGGVAQNMLVNNQHTCTIHNKQYILNMKV